MLTLQIGNSSNIAVMSCLDQGGLRSLSALVLTIYSASYMYRDFHIIFHSVRRPAQGSWNNKSSKQTNIPNECQAHLVTYQSAGHTAGYCSRVHLLYFVPMSEEKSSWNSLLTNTDELTSVIFVHTALHWALYHLFPEQVELYEFTFYECSCSSRE